MTFLPLGEPDKEKKSRKKFPILKSQLLGLGALALLITGTFATNVNVGTNGRIEFGQGSVQVVTCDTHINVTLGTLIDTSTGITYIDRVTLSDLSVQLRDRTISVQLYGSDGTKLNSNLSFSVADDGLTFTSSRSHIDTIDAFTLGAGPRQERGANQITFNNLAAPLRIEASKFSRVALETSGSGTCSVPNSIPAVAVYIDAPWVQGSYIAEDFPALTITDDYNSVTSTDTNCEDYSFPVGTYSGGFCRIFTKDQNFDYIFGGATTNTSVPTRNSPGAQSPSAFVGPPSPGQSPNGENINFGTSKNYIGFWWSAGSIGNSIKFYRNGTLFTTVTGDDVYGAVPRLDVRGYPEYAPPYYDPPYPTLNSTNGLEYLIPMYYGHPKSWPVFDRRDDPNYTDDPEDPNYIADDDYIDDAEDPVDSNDPAEIYWVNPREPFVYMHIFALNGFNFDSINISTGLGRNGFEWDNLSVANLRNADLTPKGSLVKIAEYFYNP
jgi:hypothetical protein